MSLFSRRNVVLFISVALFLSGIKYFFEITDDYYENDLNGLDAVATLWIQGSRSFPLTVFNRIITHLGDNITYVVAITGLLIYFRKSYMFKCLLHILIITLVSFAISYFIKDFIGRPRPDGNHLTKVFTMSYPSGHAFTAATFYLLVIYFTLKYKPKHNFLVISLSLFMILMIGISRVYLGVHYASDVLAGYSLGMVLVGISIFINELWTCNNVDGRQVKKI